MTLHAVTTEGSTSSELGSLIGMAEVGPRSWQVVWDSPLLLAELQGPRPRDHLWRRRLKLMSARPKGSPEVNQQERGCGSARTRESQASVHGSAPGPVPGRL